VSLGDSLLCPGKRSPTLSASEAVSDMMESTGCSIRDLIVRIVKWRQNRPSEAGGVGGQGAGW